PCIRLSFGDKLKLIAELERSREISHKKDSRFWHECRTVQRQATILTQAQPGLKEGGSLTFQMQFQVTTTEPIAELLDEMPLHCCPHYTISDIFLIDFLKGLGWTRCCRTCDFPVASITVEEITTGENTNEKLYTL